MAACPVLPQNVDRIPFGLYLKYGRLCEALATRHVEANTSIPVPRVLDALEEDDDRGIILMTALPGTPLLDSFLEMSEADLARVQETLRNWVDQLRALPSPTESVCAVDGGPCLSYRVSTHPFGPFSSIREFHNRFYKIVPGEHQDRLRALAEASHSRPHRLCFTHGDISPANVLVSGNQLTGLVDWECSGWYPEYYEYTMAVYRRQRAQKWWDLWAEIFPQYKTEVEVELAFWAVDFPW